MLLRALIVFGVCLSFVTVSVGAEHRVEILKEGPPADDVSQELLEQFATTGFKIIRGTSRTVCEIWPCKEWKTQAGFQATDQRLYPFRPGQLVGLLRFPRRGKDFRDQTINSGVYTLRYGLQPTDGNHEGTSPTRDFLLLVNAEEDELNKAWDGDALLEASAEAAGSSHPAMLCLQRAKAGSRDQPSIRHNEGNDWWILEFAGKAAANGKTQPLSVDLIVAGHAIE